MEVLWRSSGGPLEVLWKSSGGPLEAPWYSSGTPVALGSNWGVQLCVIYILWWLRWSNYATPVPLRCPNVCNLHTPVTLGWYSGFSLVFKCVQFTDYGGSGDRIAGTVA